jgi:hypothetical protein
MRATIAWSRGSSQWRRQWLGDASVGRARRGAPGS